MQNKSPTRLAILAWLVISTLYLSHTAPGERTHDFYGHLAYTKYIVDFKRLPSPHENWVTYHPPLYYLISSLFVPPTQEEKIQDHARCVQALSVLYGAVALWIISLLLKDVTQNTTTQLIALLFLATTPKFVFVFSTYNNDSLVTMLCIAMVCLCYRLSANWSLFKTLWLLTVTTAALYTKLTSMPCILAIMLICCKNFLRLKLPSANQLRIIGILILSMVLFVPWMMFHNYRLTKNLFPTSFDEKINRSFNLFERINSAKIFLKVPVLQWSEKEWSKPWVYPVSMEGPKPLATKIYDYLSFSFVTSVIGEYEFFAPSINFFWITLLIHLFGYLFAFKEAFNSPITKLAALFVFLIQFVHIFGLSNITPLVDGCFQDFRYITCSWIGWAILYANCLSKDTLLCRIAKKLFAAGIVVQVYILLTVTGSHI